MKLFDYQTYEDYGKEWFFQVLRFKKFALLDLSFQWDDYGSDDLFPMLIVNIGSRCLCGFNFRWGRFQMSCDVLETAPRNLEWYRRGESKYESID